MMIKRLLDFFSSPAIASRVPRLARCSILCSARLSSLLGNGVGAITSSATGEVLIGSTLETTGNVARAVAAEAEEAAGLMTTGGGRTGAGAGAGTVAIGLGMVTG